MSVFPSGSYFAGRSGGGGDGGKHQPTPVSLGQLPRAAEESETGIDCRIHSRRASVAVASAHAPQSGRSEQCSRAVLEAVVKRDGRVDVLRLVRSLGFGLDQNAIQALSNGAFRPAMENGMPVDVTVNIEVNFNLR